MQSVEFQIEKTIEELQRSRYHQQLGRNVCAAFIAQQQGIKIDTAYKKIDEPVGDLWLLIAEIIRQQCFQGADEVASSLLAESTEEKTIQ